MVKISMNCMMDQPDFDLFNQTEPNEETMGCMFDGMLED